MSTADLNAMSLSELRSLEKKVAKAIGKFEQREKKKALAELKEHAKKLGFSLNELTGGTMPAKAPKKPTQKAAPKYANPADTSQTWTGRGRRPAWVIAALEAGKSLDDMAI
ncbi:H-NS histone family protein [Roseovarius sp. LXJ103]|nr:H-NS histone family protein [Roseovarius carneus]PWE37412.1 transcriptional regulator [Pelagicola sp. LXJ1103]